MLVVRALILILTVFKFLAVGNLEVFLDSSDDKAPKRRMRKRKESEEFLSDESGSEFVLSSVPAQIHLQK